MCPGSYDLPKPPILLVPLTGRTSVRHAHRHDDVEERLVDLNNAGAALVDEVDEDLILIEIAQRRHDELGIEGDDDAGTVVADVDDLFSLTDFG